MWFREESKIIKQWSKARGREISQDQILGGEYATIKRQTVDMTISWIYAAQQL